MSLKQTLISFKNVHPTRFRWAYLCHHVHLWRICLELTRKIKTGSFRLNFIRKLTVNGKRKDTPSIVYAWNGLSFEVTVACDSRLTFFFLGLVSLLWVCASGGDSIEGLDGSVLWKNLVDRWVCCRDAFLAVLALDCRRLVILGWVSSFTGWSFSIITASLSSLFLDSFSWSVVVESIAFYSKRDTSSPRCLLNEEFVSIRRIRLWFDSKRCLRKASWAIVHCSEQKRSNKYSPSRIGDNTRTDQTKTLSFSNLQICN